MSKLLPGGGLLGVAKLVGTHYEVISIIYRLLGAKVLFMSLWSIFIALNIFPFPDRKTRVLAR